MSDKLHPALVKAWGEITTIEHDRKNPHFKNTYATYDSIMRKLRAILSKHGLAFTQDPTVIDDRPNVAAFTNTLVHESGETMHMGTIAVPCAKMDDPQAFGSACTYAKRYALCSIWGIPTGEDDDGNEAAVEPKDPRTRAAAAIADWTGLRGDDFKQAATEIAKLAHPGRTNGTGPDPEKIIAYVHQHKHEDFMEHIKAVKEEA